MDVVLESYPGSKDQTLILNDHPDLSDVSNIDDFRDELVSVSSFFVPNLTTDLFCLNLGLPLKMFASKMRRRPSAWLC